MKREIKFRAWDSISEVMHNWDTLNNTHLPLNDFIKLDHYHVMQFTGCKDKNGTDIYEGDIVKINIEVRVPIDFRDWLFDGENEMMEQEIKCEVIFNDSIACFDLETIEVDEHLTSYGFYGEDESIEIIGNIHENKELL